MLGLLQQTSWGPVNPVAINYLNACMVVESSVWIWQIILVFYVFDQARSCCSTSSVILCLCEQQRSIMDKQSCWMWPQNKKNSSQRRWHKLPPELGWEAPRGKNSARDDGSPSCAIRQRKHFAFLRNHLTIHSGERPLQWTCWSICV